MLPTTPARLLAYIAMSVVLASCLGQAAVQSPVPSAPSPIPSVEETTYAGSPTTNPTDSPASFETESAPPESKPSGSAVLEPTPWPVSFPPAAVLSINGRGSVLATLGSVCDTRAKVCADGGWTVPGYVLEVPAGADLAIKLLHKPSVVAFVEQYAAAEEASSLPIELTARGSASQPLIPIQEIRLLKPPAGDWVISVSVVFEKGRGDAAYYWHVYVH